MEHVGEDGVARPPCEVLEVLPARVVVQPLDVDSVISRRPRPTPRWRAAVPLATSELHAEPRPVEIIPAVWHPTKDRFVRKLPWSSANALVIHRVNISYIGHAPYCIGHAPYGGG